MNRPLHLLTGDTRLQAFLAAEPGPDRLRRSTPTAFIVDEDSFDPDIRLGDVVFLGRRGAYMGDHFYVLPRRPADDPESLWLSDGATGGGRLFRKARSGSQFVVTRQQWFGLRPWPVVGVLRHYGGPFADFLAQQLPTLGRASAPGVGGRP